MYIINRSTLAATHRGLKIEEVGKLVGRIIVLEHGCTSPSSGPECGHFLAFGKL